jgi:hypothetical protein
MILEGIVTTRDESGALNVAPMGPEVEEGSARIVLKPFATSTTYRNLAATGEGVLHVTDDVLMLARAAIGQLDQDSLATRPADIVRGTILLGACRYREFRVTTIDASRERVRIEAEVVAEGHLREFFGLNRAKHAVVEAAILATRTDFLPLAGILGEYRKLAPLIEKTGGAAEHAAFELLENHVRTLAAGNPTP